MSTTLFRHQAVRFGSKIWILLVSTVAGCLLALLFHNINSSIFQILASIIVILSAMMLVATLIVGMLLFFQSFISSLLGRQAYLIRMLPISRVQIYGTLVLEGLILALLGTFLTMFWMWTLITVMAGDLSGNLFSMFTQSGLAPAFFLTIFMQSVFILCCGMFGILFGYRRSGSKMGWSIVTGFVTYYVCQFIMVPIVFLIAFAGGWPIFDDAYVPTITDGRGILLLISGFYLLFSVLIGWYCEKRIQKGLDIDG